jgi:Anti-sigma-K factor rskA/Putative zinc-finger
MSDHARYQDDVGAYLLGALNDLERQAFERHLSECSECRDELDRLRPAAEALPGSVVQLDPPPGLKQRLMAEVEGDSKVVPLDRHRRRPTRLLAVAAVLLLGVVVGFGVAQLGGDDTRTVTATVAKAMPQAGGDLEISGKNGTLRLHDMPDLGGARVYQVWYQHGEQLVPTRTFEVGRSGIGTVELRNVENADGVFVTREARGGAQVPSEDPIVSVPL